MTRTILVVVLILTGAAGSHAAQEPSLWTYQTTDEIRSFKITRTGDLLVSFKSEIALVNAETGKMIWSRSGKMTYFEETRTGDLFVSSKSEIALVNTETGKALWSRDDIRDCEFHPSEELRGPTGGSYVLPDRTYCRYLKSKAKLTFLFSTPYALFEFKKGVAVINWLTGETLFDSTDHPLGKVLKLWYIEQSDQFMMLAEIKKKSYSLAAIGAGDNEMQWVRETPIRRTATGWKYKWLGEREDGTGLVYWEDHDKNKFLTALNLNTGEIVWQARDFLKDKIRTYRNLIYDTEETLLLFLNKDGPMRLGPDGQVLWRAEYLAGKKPSTMVYADGVLCVSQKDRVFAIDTSDGTVIWEEKVRFKPTTMVIHSRGLLVASDKIILLDLKTGKPAWTKEAEISGWISRLLPVASIPGSQLPIVLDDDVLYVAGPRGLRALNLGNGHFKIIARYKFEDKEAPTSLSVINGNFFLNSSHNLAGFGSGGVKLYQRFYKAPGASNWAKVGAWLHAAARHYAAWEERRREQRSCYEAVANSAKASRRCKQFVQSLRNTLKDSGKVNTDDVRAAWEESAPGPKSFAKRFDKEAQTHEKIEKIYRDKINQRFGTTVDTERFIYIYFEEKKKRDKEHQFGLVLFDKYAGKEVGRVWLGERNPESTLDPVTRTVFFKSDKNIIQALRFPAGPEQQTAGN